MVFSQNMVQIKRHGNHHNRFRHTRRGVAGFRRTMDRLGGLVSQLLQEEAEGMDMVAKLKQLIVSVYV